MAKPKQRLDMLLIQRGLFPSREQARGAIMAGQVLVDEQKVDKAGAQVGPEVVIRLIGEKLPFVSRGGLKLAKAIDSFHLNFTGATVIDVGASTGGFVDCALQHGAAKVYGVDVGRNQLAWKLRNDPRVVCLEQTNARLLSRDIIDDQADFITADVSFISLTLALPPAIQHLLKPNGKIAVLIKPQFEAGKEAVGKGGIVRSPEIHIQVIEKILAAAQEWGLSPQGLDFSPITGADGNIEYLFYACKSQQPAASLDPAATVRAAWQAHKGKAATQPENEKQKEGTMEQNVKGQESDMSRKNELQQQEAKNAWQGSRGKALGLDPEDYDDEEAYQEALAETKAAWQNAVSNAVKNVDPLDYDTQAAYAKAVSDEFHMLWEDDEN